MTPRKLTQKYVKELFDYRDGLLYWKERRGSRTIGDEAGHVNNRYYSMYVRIDGKNVSYGRVIFLWHHGYLPVQVWHKDGNNLNNKIENLIPFNMVIKGKLQKQKDLKTIYARKQLKAKNDYIYK